MEMSKFTERQVEDLTFSPQMTKKEVGENETNTRGLGSVNPHNLTSSLPVPA